MKLCSDMVGTSQKDLRHGGKMINIDPNGGPQIFAHYPPPDLVLITDVPGEYFDKETSGQIDLSHADIVAPQAVIDALSRIPKIKASRVLGHGESVKLHGVKIRGNADLPTNGRWWAIG